MAKRKLISYRLRFCGILLAALCMPCGVAHAFSDDEARKAILELRQQRQVSDNLLQQQANSILALSTQIQELRSELATLRGRVEELERSAQTQAAQFQPREVTVDGKTFMADPQEIKDYEAALDSLRNADYAGAVTLLQSFVMRWPKSGYLDAANFWLGNAQYGVKGYQDAINTFTALVQRSPNYMRAPDALLAVANSQVELKNSRAARAALEQLIQQYPQSDAATQARSRLSQLR